MIVGFYHKAKDEELFIPALVNTGGKLESFAARSDNMMMNTDSRPGWHVLKTVVITIQELVKAAL